MTTSLLLCWNEPHRTRLHLYLFHIHQCYDFGIREESSVWIWVPAITGDLMIGPWFDDWLNGLVLDIGKHFKYNSPSTLNHPKDWCPFRFERNLSLLLEERIIPLVAMATMQLESLILLSLVIMQYWPAIPIERKTVGIRLSVVMWMLGQAKRIVH